MRRIKANSSLKTNIQIEVCEQNTPLFLLFLDMYRRGSSLKWVQRRMIGSMMIYVWDPWV